MLVALVNGGVVIHCSVVSFDGKISTAVSSDLHTVSDVHYLTESTFILRLNRGNIVFNSGQRIIAGLPGDKDQREYSIYSGENDDYLEILVREVKNGNVSVKLKNCRPGMSLSINGPTGSFGIEPFDRYARKHIFIATGTGIAPFHSIIRSYPGINYTLIHGVAYKNEAYESDEYDLWRYNLCTSREKHLGRKRRVTNYVSNLIVSPEMLFYLCGNGSMIYEVYHILRDKGIPEENILSERYF